VDIEWRALTEKDIPAWAELLRAAEEVDREDEHYSEEDLAEEYSDPLFDPERGSLAGFVGESMVALGTVRMSTPLDGLLRMGHFGVVHPAYRGRGLGDRLLTWGPTSARPQHEERYPEATLVLNTGHIASNTAAGELFTRHGFTPNRYYHSMKRELSGDLPAVIDVKGIDIVPYSPALDEQARYIKNESFKDHWATVPRSPEQWRHDISGSVSFRPDLSFLALDTESGHAAGDAAVGVIITQYYKADTEANNGRHDAYIAAIGTLRAARGRGVATALLGTVLYAARAAGFETASLGVDSQNPTGALGVYERAGLTVNNTWISYSRRL
jgi:GNAT superfamily N-acetyltransferase